MQQVFNPLLLYFQLVHFYNNAEKKRKSFRGKTPAFFWAFFSRRDCFSDREELEKLANLGVSSFLIGESLMRQVDIENATKNLLGD